MKHFLPLFLFTLLFVSCERETICHQDKPVPVNITFSDFSFTFEDDSFTPATRVTPSEVGMNRISLSVFASDNTLAFSTTRNASVDTDNFEQFSCSLLPGDYHFVAIAHKANDPNEPAVAIASTTQATLTTSKLLKIYAVNQPVTIGANQTNNVVIDLRQAINSQFQLKTTDPTPSNVASCELLINPSSSTNTYVFSPTTGLAEQSYQYSTEILVSEIRDKTFQNVTLGVNCLLTENPQNVSITVNMKDASGAIVKTRTFTNISMTPHRITCATGSFFPSSVNSSFTLDTTFDPIYKFTF